jgi:formylglycine-generating enzyme required for sulfatase activity
MFSVLALVLALGEEVMLPAANEGPAYRIDRTEVSVGDFVQFERSGAYTNRALWTTAGMEWLKAHPNGVGAEQRRSQRGDNHPVVAVSFFEAEAYCAWKGGALPTNAQWSRAVCTTDPYPWGASQQVPAAWFTSGKHGRIQGVMTQEAHQQHPSLEGPNGLKHGAGNVWEWTQDLVIENQEYRSLRGGSYANLPSYCRCDHIEPALPSDTRLTTGFRCAYP